MLAQPMQTQSNQPGSTKVDLGPNPMSKMLWFGVFNLFFVPATLASASPLILAGLGSAFLWLYLSLTNYLPNGIAYMKRKARLQQSGLELDTVLRGVGGDFIGFDTARQKLFVDGHVFDFDDLESVQTITKYGQSNLTFGGTKSWQHSTLNLRFRNGPAALVYLRAGTETRAAELERDIQKIVMEG